MKNKRRKERQLVRTHKSFRKGIARKKKEHLDYCFRNIFVKNGVLDDNNILL